MRLADLIKRRTHTLVAALSILALPSSRILSSPEFVRK